MKLENQDGTFTDEMTISIDANPQNKHTWIVTVEPCVYVMVDDKEVFLKDCVVEVESTSEPQPAGFPLPLPEDQDPYQGMNPHFKAWMFKDPQGKNTSVTFKFTYPPEVSKQHMGAKVFVWFRLFFEKIIKRGGQTQYVPTSTFARKIVGSVYLKDNSIVVGRVVDKDLLKIHEKAGFSRTDTGEKITDPKEIQKIMYDLKDIGIKPTPNGEVTLKRTGKNDVVIDVDDEGRFKEQIPDLKKEDSFLLELQHEGADISESFKADGALILVEVKHPKLFVLLNKVVRVRRYIGIGYSWMKKQGEYPPPWDPGITLMHTNLKDQVFEFVTAASDEFKAELYFFLALRPESGAAFRIFDTGGGDNSKLKFSKVIWNGAPIDIDSWDYGAAKSRNNPIVIPEGNVRFSPMIDVQPLGGNQANQHRGTYRIFAVLLIDGHPQITDVNAFHQAILDATTSGQPLTGLENTVFDFNCIDALVTTKTKAAIPRGQPAQPAQPAPAGPQPTPALQGGGGGTP